jgi:hypothetical protein
VIPPIPTKPVSPKPVARPRAAAAVVYSPAVRPGCAHFHRALAGQQPDEPGRHYQRLGSVGEAEDVVLLVASQGLMHPQERLRQSGRRRERADRSRAP